MEKILEDELVKIFPVAKRDAIRDMLQREEGLEEIRVRVGQPLLFVYGENMKDVGEAYGEKDLEEMLLFLCEYSKYAYAKQLKEGYVTLRGGIRVGVAGEAIKDGITVKGVEYPMFLNIRIPRERMCCSNWILPYISHGRSVYHTLIISEPGGGKTTFLRDLLRLLSEQRWSRAVALVDERYEVAASYRGVPMNHVGMHTDVYSGFDKATGCMQAIRTMAPQVLGVDEIGGKEDIEVLSYAMKCGISVVATMHGGGLSDYERQKGLAFERLVWIKHDEVGRSYYVYDETGKLLCIHS